MSADDVMDAYPEPEQAQKQRIWTWQCTDCSAWTVDIGRGKHECGHCGVIKPFGAALLTYHYPLPTHAYSDAAKAVTELQLRLADVNVKDSVKTREINILTLENRSLAADLVEINQGVAEVIHQMDETVDGAIGSIRCDLVTIWASQLRVFLTRSLYKKPTKA